MMWLLRQPWIESPHRTKHHRAYKTKNNNLSSRKWKKKKNAPFRIARKNPWQARIGASEERISRSVAITKATHAIITITTALVTHDRRISYRRREPYNMRARASSAVCRLIVALLQGTFRVSNRQVEKARARLGNIADGRCVFVRVFSMDFGAYTRIVWHKGYTVTDIWRIYMLIYVYLLILGLFLATELRICDKVYQMQYNYFE